jgi:hypothetical protein
MKLANYAVVSKSDILATYAPASDYADNCIRYLAEKGLLPLNVDASFPPVNVLAGFAFYSGCVKDYKVIVYENTDKLGLLKECITDRLGIDTKVMTSMDSGGHTGSQLMVTNGGTYIARLFEAMGLPKSCGKKARMESLGIPSYRKDLFALAASDGLLGDDDRNMVRILEKDLTAVLISVKTKPKSKKCLNIRFLSRPSEEGARNFAEDNLRLINFSVPDLGLREERIWVERVPSGSYVANMSLNGSSMDCVLDANRDLLKFSPALQKLYGFDLPFEPAEI